VFEQGSEHKLLEHADDEVGAVFVQVQELFYVAEVDCLYLFC
jgi:hypothetical protein